MLTSGSNVSLMGTVFVIAGILAIVATIIICVLCMPEKKAKTLGKFGYFLHKTINFKSLLIEKIIKVFYVYTTCMTILSGLLMMVGIIPLNSGTSGSSAIIPGILAGLGTIILGPIIVRIIYEFLMLFILLVKNTISIKNKLYGEEDGGSAPSVIANSLQDTVTCVFCGTVYNKNDGFCPNCHNGGNAPQA